jgi:DNA processing protein
LAGGQANGAEATGLSDSVNDLLDALGYDPTGLDALQARTGLDTPTLQAQLMELEIHGHVARLPGGLFQRIARG